MLEPVFVRLTNYGVLPNRLDRRRNAKANRYVDAIVKQVPGNSKKKAGPQMDRNRASVQVKRPIGRMPSRPSRDQGTAGILHA